MESRSDWLRQQRVALTEAKVKRALGATEPKPVATVPRVTENRAPVTINRNPDQLSKRKRGRPKTGKAMTDAERMRRYRARKQAATR
jgi:hypothetical protein